MLSIELLSFNGSFEASGFASDLSLSFCLDWVDEVSDTMLESSLLGCGFVVPAALAAFSEGFVLQPDPIRRLPRPHLERFSRFLLDIIY